MTRAEALATTTAAAAELGDAAAKEAATAASVSLTAAKRAETAATVALAEAEGAATAGGVAAAGSFTALLAPIAVGAAAIALVYHITSDIRTEAERRLKVEEAISSANQ